VDRNPLLHRILKKTFYDQFCAGENGTEVNSTMKELKDMGFRGVIMTYAKETVFDHKTNSQQGLGIAALKSEHGDVSIDAPVQQCPSIEAWREGTVKTVDMLEEEDYLAVKYVDSLSLDILMTDCVQTDRCRNQSHRSVRRWRVTTTADDRRAARDLYQMQSQESSHPH
jgi:hypothetical protein